MIKQFKIGQFLSIKVICWAIFLLFLLMIVLVRCRLLNIPLERDEGEYAYCGQLLLQGIPPFKLAYNMKLPGVGAVYALLMAIFGQSTQGIHLGFLIVNIISIILIFFISKRLFGFIAGIFSAISYGILSISQSVLGAHAHATHFVVAMALGGVLLILKAVETEENKYVFLSGLFFGLAFLMKQQGVFFIPFGFFYLSWIHFKNRPALRSGLVFKLVTYSVGTILPFVAIFLVFFFTGVLNKFWFWTFQYASQYLSHVPLEIVLKIFKDQLIDVANPFRSIWYIAAFGFACLFIDGKARKHIVFVTTLFIASFITVWPGFIFRQHYFVTVLPIISILVGCCINTTYEFIRDIKPSSFFKFVPMIIFVELILCAMYQQKQYLFELTPAQISRLTYGPNPFIESMEIANYVKTNSFPNDTIAVLGSEPQICFYSHRRSATGYIYTYALMEKQPYALRMQQEMTHEIESAKPKYLIFVNVYTSWLRRPESENLIFEWSNKYISTYYKIVGVVDIVSPDRTNYYWNVEAQNVTPRSPYFVLIYKRQN